MFDLLGTPEDAYRFATGEEIGTFPYDEGGTALRRIRIDRPLDFAAVTDHAEWLGEVALCTRPDSPGYASDGCRAFRGEARAGLAAKLLPSALSGRMGSQLPACGRQLTRSSKGPRRGPIPKWRIGSDWLVVP